MSHQEETPDICAVTGAADAHVHVMPNGTLYGAYGSSHDTERMVFLIDGQHLPLAAGGAPLKPGDRLCDDVIDRWIAEGKLAPYHCDMDGGVAAPPEALRRAIALERGFAEECLAKVRRGELSPSRAFAALFRTREAPNVFILAMLDVLFEAALGQAPGADEMLAPWLRQRQLRNAMRNAMFPAMMGGDKDYAEPAEAPLDGHPVHITDCT